MDCCITSPPYWALRDYKIQGQLGLEPTFNEYIAKLIEIFNEVKRVLKRTGSCWVNMGDTYNGTRNGIERKQNDLSNRTTKFTEGALTRSIKQIPEKSLCLIPQRFQIQMVDAGWICRNTIIWYKPNCMPSSAKDRFTIDFEYLFFFTKSQRYYFDTQYEPLEELHEHRRDTDRTNTIRHGINTLAFNGRGDVYSRWPKMGGNKAPGYENRVYSGNQPEISSYGRIKRCVWKIPTQPFPDSHFAVFPPELVETPIKATCPIEGTILDPFIGSGTVGLVAMQNARNFLGIELNPEYIKMAYERLDPYLKQERLQFGQEKLLS